VPCLLALALGLPTRAYDVERERKAWHAATMCSLRGFARATASPFANGLKGWVSAGNYIDAFTSAEWDERGEVLRLVVTAAQAAGNVQGLYIDSAEIRHGLGPLPPSGGIDAKWYKSAHVRKFSSGDCTGGSSTRPGFGDEVCDTSVITGGATDTILFDASSEVNWNIFSVVLV
jgi:hypothetical protein